jgi:hypothetical protein
MYGSADFSNSSSSWVEGGEGGERWNSDILKRKIYKSGGTGDIQLSISPTGKGMQTGVEGPRGQDQGKGGLFGFESAYVLEDQITVRTKPFLTLFS